MFPSIPHHLQNVQPGAFLSDTGPHIHTADPNAPELFANNMRVALDQLMRVQELARSTLTGIENAYEAGRIPSQTQNDFEALHQALQLLVVHLQQSGVGGLPLAPQQDILADTARCIPLLFERLKRVQEGPSVVANLLQAPTVGR